MATGWRHDSTRCLFLFSRLFFKSLYIGVEFTIGVKVVSGLQDLGSVRHGRVYILFLVPFPM